MFAKCQALKGRWQLGVVQTLVEEHTKLQVHQTARQCCVVQTLVEVSAECQAKEGAWQSYVVQALVESIAKFQVTEPGRQKENFMIMVVPEPHRRHHI